jgi:NitT/TauT family transport system substrate-binding protein
MVARVVALLGALLVATCSSAWAETLKLAIPQRGFWDTSIAEYAIREGFFKKVGLDIEVFYTAGGAETLTAVMSGSVDIALANGTLGVVGAYAKGAPIRVISAQMTGANEVFWYVPANSTIKDLKDADGKTAAFSSPGSSTNLILLALLKQTGSKARPVATGGFPSTQTQVMSGQIDIGWAVPPFAVKELADGKIRVVAKAADATALRDQTIRVNLANVNVLNTRRDAVTRFMQVYGETIDWAYSNPKSIDYFAEDAKVTRDVAQKSVDDFYPKSALQLTEIRGLQQTLDEALETKRLTERKTPADMAGLFDILYKQGK